MRADLPQLDEQAIWPASEKPRIEYCDLQKAPSPTDGDDIVFLHQSFGDKQMFLYVSPSAPSLGSAAALHLHSMARQVCETFFFLFPDLTLNRKNWPSPMCSPLRLETESRAYKACEGKTITPGFLAHVTEDGRVIGFLIEYIIGTHEPTDEEKELCRAAVRRFHRLTGWHRVYSQNCRENFLVKDGRVWLVNLGRAMSPRMVASRASNWSEEVMEEDFDLWWDYHPQLTL